ncbi:angiopoietin-4-like [Asterias rubens]|uniref:angiopoietin-4-like n=1 Tax=Asterias rubens TaxID=7604 RepID=UPI0014555178|nr:angiopoietin-4-like [Asterias rubens]
MREFVSASNKELRLVPYWEKITRSPVICVSYCHSDPNCQSVNYHTSSHLCQLNNVTRAQYPDDFNTLYGSLYFDASANTSLLSQDATPSVDTSNPYVGWTSSAPSTEPDRIPSSASTPEPSTQSLTSAPSTQPDTTLSSASIPKPLKLYPTTVTTTVQPVEPTDQTTLTDKTRTPSQKTFSTPPTATPVSVTEPWKLTSCKQLLEAGVHESGVYTIFPLEFTDGLEVYCDMETDGGGWIVIQRRQDGSVNFNRNWAEYRDGFGDLSGGFWLGNEKIRILTESFGPWQLRVVAEDPLGNYYVSDYFGFSITGANYNVDYSSYSVLNVESSTGIKGKPFSTADRINYDGSAVNCPSAPAGGWWFADDCKDNLNGPYESISVEGIPFCCFIRLGTSVAITSCRMEIRI